MSIVIKNAKAYVKRGVFAESIRIENGVIRAVGSNEDVLNAAPAGARVIDAAGKTVVPGFNDSHMHLYDLGSSMKMIKVYGAASIGEIIESGREFIRKNNPPEGKVLRGVGWNQDYFTDEKRPPNRHDLDRISTKHAIIVDRVCGHLVSCNTLALQIAGIDGNTKQVEGGHFGIGEDGLPDGVFGENAIYMLKKIIPPVSEDDMRENVKFAMDYVSGRGVTSIQSRDVTGPNLGPMVHAFQSLRDAGRLTARICMQCSAEEEALFRDLVACKKAVGDDGFLKVGPLKIFADGSLGSKTAWMRSDYVGGAGSRGLRVMPQEEMDAIVKMASDSGVQVICHAIGDAAIDEVLSSYAKVIAGGVNRLRHGVVHCQITDMGILRRFKEIDALAFVQPVFLEYDLHIVEDRVGKALAATSYGFGTMDKLGVHVSYGTDSPVESPDPIANLHCAVNRQDLKGFPEGGFYPGEKADIYSAVDNYTAGSAYASFEENVKGRIKAGHCADLVMLDQDIFTIPPEEIINTKVLMTMLGGEIIGGGF